MPEQTLAFVEETRDRPDELGEQADGTVQRRLERLQDRTWELHERGESKGGGEETAARPYPATSARPCGPTRRHVHSSRPVWTSDCSTRWNPRSTSLASTPHSSIT